MTPTAARLAACLVASVLALPLAGCGATSGSSPSNSSGSSVTPVLSSAGCHATLSLTEADNGSTVCLATGGTLTLTLHSTSTAWSPPVAAGVLTSAKAVTAAAGATTADFTAKTAGSTKISAYRKNCPTTAGQMSCHSMVAFSLTVEVK